MRIETIPLILGAIAALIGIALILDAWTEDELIVRRERRRRPRMERHRGGEAAVGFGILCMAAAFFGRDTWSFSIIAVMVGTLLLIYGMVVNRPYLAQAITNRGALRRREDEAQPLPPPRDRRPGASVR
jgi:peptidoglycan/LPS O-acetylase OafA/YrhL